MKNHLLIAFVIVATLLSSCASYNKNLYFQGVERNPEKSYKINNFTPSTIQVGDIIGINVKSLNSEGSAIFNTGSVSSSKEKDASSSAGGAGYLVDKNGEIQLPLVHNIKLSELTLVEAQAVIKKAITPFLKEPEVTVTLMNFKISILGDVNKPSVFTVSDDRISIPQALSLAGDLSTTAKRENILLIREIDGNRKYINIDMTSPALFNSPYYYLKNNDVLYVEPGKAKFANQNQFLKILPIVLSVISLGVATYQIAK